MTDAVIPTDALEGLMKKTFVEKAVPAGLFWDALLKANLYTPLVKGSASHSSSEEEIEDYPLLLGSDSEGKNVVWLFTSPATMKTYIDQDLPHLEMGSQLLFSKLEGIEYDVVMIGPSGLTLGLHPDLIKSLGEGKVPDTADQKIKFTPMETEVKVGPPVEVTETLEKKFEEVFQSLPEVLEACFVQIEDDNGSRLLLGLRLQDESREKLKVVAQKVAEAAEGTLDRGKTMDITLISGSLNEAFKKYGKTFFRK